MKKEAERLFCRLTTQSEVDENNNLIFAEFEIVDEDGISSARHDFTYSTDGELEKWIFTNTTQTPDIAAKEEDETVFIYDHMGCLFERKRMIRSCGLKGNTQKVCTYWYKFVESFAERERFKEFLQVDEDKVYIITRTDDMIYTPDAEKVVCFLVVHTDGDMRYESYILPVGVLSFRKQYRCSPEKPAEKKDLRYLSPVGGTFHWRIHNADNESDIAVALYDMPLTLEIYKEIVQYCKTVRPALDFITFEPEGFIQGDDHDQIRAYVETSGIRYGCS